MTIKIGFECRCPNCDDYFSRDLYVLFNEDDGYRIYCDSCGCELFSIEFPNYYDSSEIHET